MGVRANSLGVDVFMISRKREMSSVVHLKYQVIVGLACEMECGSS